MILHKPNYSFSYNKYQGLNVFFNRKCVNPEILKPKLYSSRRLIAVSRLEKEGVGAAVLGCGKYRGKWRNLSNFVKEHFLENDKLMFMINILLILRIWQQHRLNLKNSYKP